MNIVLTGPLAGAVVAGLGLMLLFARPSWLYRSQNVPLWATIFYRFLGLLLLALATALLSPALQPSSSW